MPCGKLEVGDEVAILPDPHARPAEVLAIERVAFVSLSQIQLSDGNRYNRFGGSCLNEFLDRYAVPATDEHRVAFKAKRG